MTNQVPPSSSATGTASADVAPTGERISFATRRLAASSPGIDEAAFFVGDWIALCFAAGHAWVEAWRLTWGF